MLRNGGRCLGVYFFLICLPFSVSLWAQAPPSGDSLVSSNTPKIDCGASITLVVGQGTTAHLLFDLAEILASTNEMREFCRRMSSAEGVWPVGEIRQHQRVEVDGRLQQLKEAGRRTAKLQLVFRRKDPALKKLVEMLTQGQVMGAIEGLENRARVGQIVDPQERAQIIARHFPGRQDAGRDQRHAFAAVIHIGQFGTLALSSPKHSLIVKSQG